MNDPRWEEWMPSRWALRVWNEANSQRAIDLRRVHGWLSNHNIPFRRDESMRALIRPCDIETRMVSIKRGPPKGRQDKRVGMTSVEVSAETLALLHEIKAARGFSKCAEVLDLLAKREIGIIAQKDVTS